MKRTLVFLAAAAALSAQDYQLQLDPAQTRVDFTLSATMHTVHGSFALKQGSLTFDPATHTATGKLIVDATSGKSGDGSRDSKMHKDILESARYPEIVFTADRFNGDFHPSGDSDVTLHGAFRIHGADHELDLPVHVHASTDMLSADTQFSVPYIKWGMKNPSTFVLRVGDTVTIAIHATGRVSK